MSQEHHIELEETADGGSHYVEFEGTRAARILWTTIPEGIDIKSTAADESMRGTGIARKLVEKTVALAKERNWKIRATCPYANKVISGNEDFAKLLLAD